MNSKKRLLEENQNAIEYVENGGIEAGMDDNTLNDSNYIVKQIP